MSIIRPFQLECIVNWGWHDVGTKHDASGEVLFPKLSQRGARRQLKEPVAFLHHAFRQNKARQLEHQVFDFVAFRRLN